MGDGQFFPDDELSSAFFDGAAEGNSSPKYNRIIAL